MLTVMPKTLLIVYHTLTGGTLQMAQAAAGGADDAEDSLTVRLVRAPQATAAPLLNRASAMCPPRLRHFALCIALCGLDSCSVEAEQLTVPAPDASEFATKAYPVLQRDCGFPACHGSPQRFFRVFGPGRTRLRPETDPFADPTPEELMQSYDRARSMLASTGDLGLPLLLRKPLDLSAGGTDHGGRDNWGRNVYQNTDAPGYQVLRRWADTAPESAP